MGPHGYSGRIFFATPFEWTWYMFGEILRYLNSPSKVVMILFLKVASGLHLTLRSSFPKFLNSLLDNSQTIFNPANSLEDLTDKWGKVGGR